MAESSRGMKQVAIMGVLAGVQLLVTLFYHLRDQGAVWMWLVFVAMVALAVFGWLRERQPPEDEEIIKGLPPKDDRY